MSIAGAMGVVGSLGTGPYATSVVSAVGANPFATSTWYVDSVNGGNGNTGRSPKDAFASMATALTASAAGDNFIIAPGSYTISASFVPLANQSFIAAISHPRKPTVIFLSASIADLVQVDVSGTRWFGIELQAGDATCDNLMDIADAAAVTSILIDTCVFNGADQTSVVGLQADDATFAVTNMVVRNCVFRNLTGTMLDIGVKGMAYSYIGYNTFVHEANSQKGIALADTTTFIIGKAWVIEHNNFLPFDATGDEVGISIAGTEDTTGAGLIKNNYFSYSVAGTAVTIDKLGKATINNYVAAATGGGTIVTTGT